MAKRKRKQKKESRHLLLKGVLAGAVVWGMASGVQHAHLHIHVHGGHLFLTDAPAGSAAANKQYAQHEMKVLYGWGTGQWRCLDGLWTGESNWRQTADTRKSGLDPAAAKVFAYGIAQARGHGDVIGGVTAPYPPAYAAANPASFPGGKNNPRTQIRWGLGYIRWNTNFHTPCGAVAYKRANGGQGY